MQLTKCCGLRIGIVLRGKTRWCRFEINHVILLLVFVLQVGSEIFIGDIVFQILINASPPRAVSTPSPECVRICRSCDPNPICAPGVSLVQDDCGCCKVCARQVGEICNKRMKCDPHKNLYCTYSDVDTEERRCAVMPGRSCYSGEQIYGNGESFHLGCKATCTCTNGYIGCFPRCPTTRSARPPTVS